MQLQLVAAMQSLHREGDLLPATQKNVLSAMLKEHGATATQLRTADGQTSQYGRSRTGSSDGAISGDHLVSGNQASPGMPRHSSHATRRPSDLGPPISGGLSFLTRPIDYCEPRFAQSYRHGVWSVIQFLMLSVVMSWLTVEGYPTLIDRC